jgi:hypothetical protein
MGLLQLKKSQKRINIFCDTKKRLPNPATSFLYHVFIFLSNMKSPLSTTPRYHIYTHLCVLSNPLKYGPIYLFL